MTFSEPPPSSSGDRIPERADHSERKRVAASSGRRSTAYYTVVRRAGGRVRKISCSPFRTQSVPSSAAERGGERTTFRPSGSEHHGDGSASDGRRRNVRDARPRSVWKSKTTGPERARRSRCCARKTRRKSSSREPRLPDTYSGRLNPRVPTRFETICFVSYRRRASRGVFEL